MFVNTFATWRAASPGVGAWAGEESELDELGGDDAAISQSSRASRSILFKIVYQTQRRKNLLL